MTPDLFQAKGVPFILSLRRLNDILHYFVMYPGMLVAKRERVLSSGQKANSRWRRGNLTIAQRTTIVGLDLSLSEDKGIIIKMD